jgi:hypothetical protein
MARSTKQKLMLLSFLFFLAKKCHEVHRSGAGLRVEAITDSVMYHVQTGHEPTRTTYYTDSSASKPGHHNTKEQNRQETKSKVCE